MTASPHPAQRPAQIPAPNAAPNTDQKPAPAFGKQYVKFSFYRLRDDLRRATAEERMQMGNHLSNLLECSAERMLTRTYSTIGTRADTDFLIWQVADDLPIIMDWHTQLLASPLGGVLERPHSYLSMTMRSQYTNPIHDGARSRETIRTDGGVDDYLFVYPMVKSRPWYALPHDERQRIMDEHIAIGHRYHGIKINTTYSFGLDDQEFVVAFEGNNPAEFLALVKELRDSKSSAYTLTDTPMFTCRRRAPATLLRDLSLATQERA